MFFKTELIDNKPQGPSLYVGKLQVQIYRSFFQSSGVLIADNCVLTAASNLYDIFSKKCANNIKFSNEKNEEKLTASSYRLPLAFYQEPKGYIEDFAVAILKDKCSLPFDGQFKVKALTDDQLRACGSVVIFSFAFDGSGTMPDGDDDPRVACKTSGTIEQITPDKLFYDVEKDMPGSSGAGVFVIDEHGEYILVGLHLYGGGTNEQGKKIFPSGMRLTESRLALISKWLKQCNIENHCVVEHDEQSASAQVRM